MRLVLPRDLEQIALLIPDLAGPECPERVPDVTAAAFCAWKYFSNPLGTAFVYVRPNESSFHILTKDLAFQEVQKLDERRFVAPSAALERKTGVPSALPRRLGADWVARRALLPRAFPNIRLEPVARFGAEVEEWWTTVGPKFTFALVRSHQYLNWRYIDCPSPYQSLAAFRDGRFAGYLTSFLLQRNLTGYILDLVTDPDDNEAAGELLRCCVNGLLDRGATAVSTWTVHSGSRTAGSAVLQKACPLRDHPPLHVAARFLDDQAAGAGFPPGSWQLNLGDFDGV